MPYTSQVQKLRLKFYEQCKQVDLQLREYQNILEELSSKCDVTKAAFITFNDCVGAYLAKKVYTVYIIKVCMVYIIHVYTLYVL